MNLEKQIQEKRHKILDIRTGMSRLLPEEIDSYEEGQEEIKRLAEEINLLKKELEQNEDMVSNN